MQVVVLPGHVHKVGVALLPGVLRGAGVGAYVEDLFLENGVTYCQEDVGKDDAGEEVDPVALEHTIHGLAGYVGVLLVVGHDNLDRQAPELVVEVAQGQVEAVANVNPQGRPTAREGAHEADLDRARLGQRERKTYQPQENHQPNCFFHPSSFPALELERGAHLP